MQLKVSTDHKSIKEPLASGELPEFLVITGSNGAGKSHLLEAIAQQAVEVHTSRPEAQPFGSGYPAVRYFGPAQLQATGSGPSHLQHIATVGVNSPCSLERLKDRQRYRNA